MVEAERLKSLSPQSQNTQLMYNVQKAIECFMPQIGWRQNVDRSRKITDTDLLKSDSGRYYQDFHPLITHNNILSCMEDISLVSFDVFEVDTFYQKGEIVRTPESEMVVKYYERLQYGQGNLLTDAEHWKEVQIDEYWHWLRQENEAAITQALDDWCTQHLNGVTSDLTIESRKVWNLPGDGSLLAKDDFFVYQQIDLEPDNQLATTIHEISLYFDTMGSYEILLFKSGQSAPFRTVTVDYTEAGSIQWVDLPDWVLPHDGSVYWLGYNQNDVPGQAYDQSKPMYNSGDLGYHCVYTDTFELRVGKTPYLEDGETLTPISTIWDFATNKFDSSLGSIGLNFRYTTQCDFSDYLDRNKSKFLTLIGLQMAIRLLQVFINNPGARINRHQKVMNANEIRFELGGDSQGRPGGLEAKYRKALKALNISNTQISKHCLPCGKGTISFKHYST